MNKEGKLYRIITFFDNYGLEITNIAISGFGFAAIGILYEIDKEILWGIESQTLGLIIFILVFLLDIYIGYRLIRKNKSKQELISLNSNLGLKIQRLENDLDEFQRNTMETFNYHLATIFTKLNLTDKERVSFYKFQNNKFHIVGRYSINPELDKIHRKYYPADEGLIGLAWKNGEFHLNSDIPDFNSGKKSAYYKKINSLAKINEDTLKDINMKARSFYLKAFTDSTKIKRNSIIVFESENENEFHLENIRNEVNNIEQQLVAFIERLTWELPTVDNAQEKGF